jgi:hypothetical protein
MIMPRQTLIWFSFVGVLAVLVSSGPVQAQGFDLRGAWVGNAQGDIFGAEGSVVITDQQGDTIHGIVEGGNFLGRAKFRIAGQVRGNQIFGTMDGHTFQGYVYGDGAIRGVFRASDGDTYKVFLQRQYSQWRSPYQGSW